MTFATMAAFAALSALVLLTPGKAAKLLVATTRAAKLKLTVATVLGASFGYTMLAIFITGTMRMLAFSIPETVEALQIPGMAVIFILLLRLWRAPLHVGPIADNDNIAANTVSAGLYEASRSTLFNLRASCFLLAFLTQVEPASLRLINTETAFALVFSAVATVTCLLQALFHKRIEQLIRKRSSHGKLKTNGRTMLISARSVSAGYRKIAA